MENDDTPFGQQIAFSETYDLIETLSEDPRFTTVDVGRGVLIAAVSCLRKELSDSEIAKIFYEYGDDFACRKNGM